MTNEQICPYYNAAFAGFAWDYSDEDDVLIFTPMFTHYDEEEGFATEHVTEWSFAVDGHAATALAHEFLSAATQAVAQRRVVRKAQAKGGSPNVVKEHYENAYLAEVTARDMLDLMDSRRPWLEGETA